MKNKYLYLTATYDPLDEDCDFYVYKLEVFKTDNNYCYAKTVHRNNKYSDCTFCIDKKGLYIKNDLPLFPILMIWKSNYKEYWYNAFLNNRKLFYQKILKNPDMWNDFIEYMVYHSEKEAFVEFAQKLGFVGVNSRRYFYKSFS